MRGLLLRLSEVDSEAEAALRVIATYDALVAHRASLEALARTTAGLAECTVGIWDANSHAVIRVTRDGRTAEPSNEAAIDSASDDGSNDGPSAEVVVAGIVVGRVWLERNGARGAHDDIVLERFGLAASLLWRTGDIGTDPAQVEALLSPASTDLERAQAVRRLGWTAATSIRLVGFARVDGAGISPRDHAEVNSVLGARTSARSAVIGSIAVGLQDARESPPEALTGFIVMRGRPGPAVQSHESWRDVAAGLRLAAAVPLLTGTTSDVVDLGSMVTLTDIPRERAAAMTDVRALRTLPDDDLTALEAFLATGSLRAAGALLHRHHSSVATRLDRVEQVLGVDLSGVPGAARAHLALVLMRLNPE